MIRWIGLLLMITVTLMPALQVTEQRNSIRSVTYLPLIQVPRLPASVVFLQNNQVWRLDADGRTLTQLTQERAPIQSLDVARGSGTLVYVVGTGAAAALVRADSTGRERMVLATGDIRNARWSPDGSQIAFSRYQHSTKQGGIYHVAASGGTPHLLQANEPKRDPDDFEEPPGRVFQLVNWSPEGNRLLLYVNPDHGNGPAGDVASNYAAIKPLHSNLRVFRSAGVWNCLTATWSTDGTAFYCADSAFTGDVALLRVDAQSGRVTPLIQRGSGVLTPFVTAPQQIGDSLSFFLAPIFQGDDTNTALYGMYRAPMNRLDMRMPVRNDRFGIPANSALQPVVLWARDGSGAVISQNLLTDAMLWLPANGSAPVVLPSAGRALHWGW